MRARIHPIQVRTQGIADELNLNVSEQEHATVGLSCAGQISVAGRAVVFGQPTPGPPRETVASMPDTNPGLSASSAHCTAPTPIVAEITDRRKARTGHASKLGRSAEVVTRPGSADQDVAVLVTRNRSASFA
jgi:hypothetical protein